MLEDKHMDVLKVRKSQHCTLRGTERSVGKTKEGKMNNDAVR